MGLVLLRWEQRQVWYRYCYLLILSFGFAFEFVLVVASTVQLVVLIVVAVVSGLLRKPVLNLSFERCTIYYHRRFCKGRRHFCIDLASQQEQDYQLLLLQNLYQDKFLRQQSCLDRNREQE